MSALFDKAPRRARACVCLGLWSLLAPLACTDSTPAPDAAAEAGTPAAAEAGEAAAPVAPEEDANATTAESADAPVAEPPKPAAEIIATPEPAVELEPDTVPIAPIKLVAASVTWRAAATPSESLSLVELQGGVLARGASGLYDIAEDGQLTLRDDVEAPAAELLGVWPKDAWYVEARTKMVDEDGRGDLTEARELRLMRLRNGKRWVPQYFGSEQRFRDTGQELAKSVTGGMLGTDPLADIDWFRVADNGDDPDFGVHHGEERVAFFETGARKFYTVSKGLGRPELPEPEAPAAPDAPAEAAPAAPDAPVDADVPAPADADTPAPADAPDAPLPPAAPEAPVDAPAAPTAPAEAAPEAEVAKADKVPALFVQTFCEDQTCVANRARKLPLGTDWTFAQQIPRKRHHLSAIAQAAGREFLLHYEKKQWLLEESSAGSFGAMWPTKDGGMWVHVDAQLWHRDPDGGWRNVVLPEGLGAMTVAMSEDKQELWIAGMLAGSPVVFATQATAQEPPKDDPVVAPAG